VNLMFLNNDRSVPPEAGSANGAGTLRGFGRPCCGRAAKAEALNNLLMVCGAPELGSPI